MKWSELLPSKYLAAEDLGRHTPTVTIRAVTVEEVGAPPRNEKKPVLWFEGKDKGLVINMTRKGVISSLFGNDVDNCIGGHIQLYAAKVKAFGKIQDTIGIRGANTIASAPDPIREADAHEIDDDDDDDVVSSVARDTGKGWISIEDDIEESVVEYIESLADAPDDSAASLATPGKADNPFETEADGWGGWTEKEDYPKASAWGESAATWGHKKHFSAAWTKAFVAADAGKDENAAEFLAAWRDVVNAHVADVEAA